MIPSGSATDKTVTSLAFYVIPLSPDLTVAIRPSPADQINIGGNNFDAMKNIIFSSN